jgi:hypothetical protein
MEENLTPWQRYKQNLGDTRPWDLLNPNTQYVDEETQSNRLNICKGCPDFVSLTTQCKKCGCFMKFKAKLELASCPVGNW